MTVGHSMYFIKGASGGYLLLLVLQARLGLLHGVGYRVANPYNIYA